MKKQTKYRVIRKITKITRDTANDTKKLVEMSEKKKPIQESFWTDQIQFVAMPTASERI